MMHLDSGNGHDWHSSRQSELFDTISEFMDMNAAKHGRTNNLFSTGKIPRLVPQITHQEGECEGGLVMIFWMCKLISNRNRPMVLSDVQDQLRSKITKCSEYRYETKDMNSLRQELLLMCLALRSLQNTFVKPLAARERIDLSFAQSLSVPMASTKKAVSGLKSEKIAATENKPANDKVGVDSKHAVSGLKSETTVDTAIKPANDAVAGLNSDTAIKPANEEVGVDCKEDGTIVTCGVITGKRRKERTRKRTSDQKMIENQRRKLQRKSRYYAGKIKEGLINVLHPSDRRKIEWWEGDMQSGSFVSAWQMSEETEVREYASRRTIKGCVIMRLDVFNCLDLIDTNRIKRAIPVLWGTFHSTQLTGPISFSTYSEMAHCLVQWNWDMRWLSITSISRIENSSQRIRKSPDRLSTDHQGKLVFKSMDGPSNEKDVNRIYKKNFCRIEVDENNRRIIKAEDVYVEHLLRNGDVHGALNEVIRLKERSRDDRGRPIGRADQSLKKVYENFNDDEVRKERLTLNILYEMVKGIRGAGAVGHPTLSKPDQSVKTEPDQHQSLEEPVKPKKKRKRCRRNDWPHLTKRKRKRTPHPSLPSTSETDLIEGKCLRCHRKQSPKFAPYCANHRLCDHDGCQKFMVSRYYPYCCDHKSCREKMEECSRCGKEEARSHGGLCRSCFKKDFPDAKTLRDGRMCIVCKARVTGRVGGTCTVCQGTKLIT